MEKLDWRFNLAKRFCVPRQHGDKKVVGWIMRAFQARNMNDEEKRFRNWRVPIYRCIHEIDFLIGLR